MSSLKSPVTPKAPSSAGAAEPPSSSSSASARSPAAASASSAGGGAMVITPAARAQTEKLQSERAVAAEILESDEHGAAMAAILEQNGWSRDDFVNRNHEMKLLELFLVDFAPSVPQLHFFPHLTTLRLMHAQLAEIAYLDKLRCLEVLFLTENNIKKIEGLDTCTALRELHLTNNSIQRIENLDRLTKLEVLALSRNEIAVIENLEALVNLRVLWLAANKIKSLVGCLSKNKALENLNLSANSIGSFREIPCLNELPNLTMLNFADPVYGDNPVCGLSNYQTFTLFHVQRITTLDHVAVSPDQRSVAEATFVKKKIYYNMRIRTLKRNLELLVKQLRAAATAKAADVYHALDMLRTAEEELEKVVSEAKVYGAPSTATITCTREADASPSKSETSPSIDVEKCKTKLAAISKLVAQRHRELAAIDTRAAITESRMARTVDCHISRLLAELHTGGNVRLEDGRSKEVWHQSCVELLKTRFFPPDFEGLGLKEMKISKVTRIHNRTLRIEFDRTLESLVDVSDPNYKRALEYLFYAGDLGDDELLNGFIENGFPATGAGSAAGGGITGVPVTNSVFLADQARLAAAKKRGELPLDTSTNVAPSDVLVGRIIVAKVFLGKCSPERGGGATSASPSGSAIQDVTNVLSTASPQITRGDYPPTTASVFRTKHQDPKQRVWYCFEPTLVLPEYIIEFSYTPVSALVVPAAIADWGPSRADEMAAGIRKALPCATAIDVADCRIFGHHFLQFAAWCKATAGPSSVGSRESAAAIAAEPNFSIVAITDEQDKAADASSPSLLLDTYAKPWGVSVADTPPRLSYVNLMSQGLRDVSGVLPASLVPSGSFAAITELVLSHNSLSRVEPVLEQFLPQLVKLDLAHNNIKRLQSLKFKQLQTLLLDANLIFRWDDVASLRGQLPALRVLGLLQNPVMDERRLAEFVVFELPTLVALNGRDCAAMRNELAPRPHEMSLPLLAAVAAATASTNTVSSARPTNAVKPRQGLATRDQLWPGVFTHMLREPLYEFAPALCELGANSGDISAADEAVLKRATSLSLAALRLTAIRHLHHAPHLAHLQLTSNFIMRIEGLTSCVALETLDLRDNRISAMEGLGSLANLRKLDLGHNFIDTIAGLENLGKLTLLSLDHNNITSIAPLAAVPSLMEVYLSDNKIANEKEVNCLRDMAKLIIMDLSHNPCTQAELYRLYAIFQVKKLKVLDGISIDPQESQLAKDTFAGRISTELLNERVAPGTTWSAARELNLASCALKELTLLDAFVNLAHLKLEHNALQSLNGLQLCVNLVTLNLSFNKLGSCVIGIALEAMTSLESVSLEANQIPSMANMQLRLPKLKFLNLKNNDITRVDGLAGIPQLREILLDKNKLRALDRECFAATPLLRELYCEENAIKNIEGVRALVNLHKFSIASNRLAEISDVEKCVEGLPIVDLCVLGNPVVRKTLYRNTMIHVLPGLATLDNKPVTPEERDRIEAMFLQESIPPNVFTDVRSPVTGGGPIMIAVPQPPSKTALRVMTLDGGMGFAGVDGGGGGGGGLMMGIGGGVVNSGSGAYYGVSGAVGGGGGAGRQVTGAPARATAGPPAAAPGGKGVVTRTSSADLRGAKPRSTSTNNLRRR